LYKKKDIALNRPMSLYPNKYQIVILCYIDFRYFSAMNVKLGKMRRLIPTNFEIRSASVGRTEVVVQIFVITIV